MKQFFKKNFEAYIAKTNKAFEAASPEQKRVMIAKDVILRLKRKNLVARGGHFIQRDFSTSVSSDSSAKDFLNKKSTECTVCAKGALFCSLIGRVNDFSMRRFYNERIQIGSFHDSFHGKLLEFFSGEQIDLIETAFEGTSYLRAAQSTINAEVFFYKYGNDSKENADNRLMGICQNIIDNNGTFIP